ncbi:hypothetical protein LMG22037_04671 [Paraburkholderia phenoliruptrix]|uniref:Helix-turn-helix domain-containing protein n=1 Tax=Paraburkholderia phenoliruptrix TaxID=252970 RepID=A0A6J5BWY2_9BURK|nr:helix-turn-helix domain-containing protein [Paraburkholderia phenoliruptrix]CAB3719885.1 hypothetical protein LMG22037_04671 [Paraburkholderia phenoliruptrix]
MSILKPRLYRISDVMTMLNISRATVYRLVDAGRLTKMSLGHRTSRITAESVDALLAPHTGQTRDDN